MIGNGFGRMYFFWFCLTPTVSSLSLNIFLQSRLHLVIINLSVKILTNSNNLFGNPLHWVIFLLSKCIPDRIEVRRSCQDSWLGSLTSIFVWHMHTCWQSLDTSVTEVWHHFHSTKETDCVESLVRDGDLGKSNTKCHGKWNERTTLSNSLFVSSVLLKKRNRVIIIFFYLETTYLRFGGGYETGDYEREREES